MPRKTGTARGCAASRCRASMRPRPDAAENLNRNVRWKHALLTASMRPRPDAAENSCNRFALSQVTLGFNEAAARCRGKLLIPS